MTWVFIKSCDYYSNQQNEGNSGTDESPIDANIQLSVVS